MATFGDLHVVVNNAGILRDRMLVSMTEQDLDDVVAVHMKGTFNMSHHAADYWRERSKAGDTGARSIVNTSSGAGLHGNPGQTNYAAAKAGIAAMTVVNAKELGRYGVKVNCIAPIARTRLTTQTPGLGEAMDKSVFDPENISPLVAVLATADCPFTGQVFSVYGGSVGIYAGWSIADEVEAERSVDRRGAGRGDGQAAPPRQGQRPVRQARRRDEGRRMSYEIPIEAGKIREFARSVQSRDERTRVPTRSSRRRS